MTLQASGSKMRQRSRVAGRDGGSHRARSGFQHPNASRRPPFSKRKNRKPPWRVCLCMCASLYLALCGWIDLGFVSAMNLHYRVLWEPRSFWCAHCTEHHQGSHKDSEDIDVIFCKVWRARSLQGIHYCLCTSWGAYSLSVGRKCASCPLQKIAEKNHVQLLWLQRLCFSGFWVPVLVVRYFQLATSVPHDFSDLADECMASYWWFVHAFLPGAYLFWGSTGVECLLMGQDGHLLLAGTPTGCIDGWNCWHPVCSFCYACAAFFHWTICFDMNFLLRCTLAI